MVRRRRDRPQYGGVPVRPGADRCPGGRVGRCRRGRPPGRAGRCGGCRQRPGRHDRHGRRTVRDSARRPAPRPQRCRGWPRARGRRPCLQRCRRPSPRRGRRSDARSARRCRTGHRGRRAGACLAGTRLVRAIGWRWAGCRPTRYRLPGIGGWGPHRYGGLCRCGARVRTAGPDRRLRLRRTGRSG